MLQTVDEIPERSGEWKTKKIHFPGKEESFTIYHQDPIEAIQSLWGDPALADHLVYWPSRVFRNTETGQKQIFNKMWTGKWWWTAQVCIVLTADNKLSPTDTGTLDESQNRDNCASHYCH
jgi:hypothetical protein